MVLPYLKGSSIYIIVLFMVNALICLELKDFSLVSTKILLLTCCPPSPRLVDLEMAL